MDRQLYKQGKLVDKVKSTIDPFQQQAYRAEENTSITTTNVDVDDLLSRKMQVLEEMSLVTFQAAKMGSLTRCLKAMDKGGVDMKKLKAEYEINKVAEDESDADDDDERKWKLEAKK